MPRRVSLPIEPDKRLSLARARAKLGGRPAVHGAAGQLVQVVRGEEPRMGVVVWSDGVSCDVCTGHDRIVRTSKLDVLPSIAAAGEPLVSIARAAKGFSMVKEGDKIFVDGQSVTLVEKCRWGALVARADGSILAVGFRRVARHAS